MGDVEIKINPPIPKGELYRFYERNGICEAGYGLEKAETILNHLCTYICVIDKDGLIEFARALSDGLHAWIVEFCLDLRYQDINELGNGCFIDSDPQGIAKRMAEELLKKLRETVVASSQHLFGM